MANPSYTYTLTNGTTADASQVMQNFNDILNGVTDGSKDLSISALTVAGTATLNGNINLGNASADDLTITASLASSLAIKTTNSYAIGSSSLVLSNIFSTLYSAGAGSASAPAFEFTGDTNTGIYSVGADDLGISAGGTLRLDVSTTAVTSTLPFLGAAGSASAPQYSFSSDTNTGTYSVGADDWGVSAGGTLRFDISTTAITSTIAHLGPSGAATAGNVTYSFSGDTNTGVYSVGADDIGIATGGTLRFDISTTAITSTIPHLNADGSASAPAFSFSGDTDCGMYRVGTNNIGWAVNGTARGQISSDGSWAIGTLTTTALNVDHSCSGRWNMKTPSANGRMDWSSDATANGVEYIRFNDNAGKTGDITINGVAHTTAYNTSSDARLKTSVADFDAIAMIRKMHPAEYERISQPGVKEYGFIAQELYEVLPQAVTRGDLIPLRDGEDAEKNQMWSVDYGKVTGVLCRGIQQLLTMYEILDAKI